MAFFEHLAKRRAARRAGYKMNEVVFGQDMTPSGDVVWDGMMYEAATGREICPFALQPCDYQLGSEGVTITFFKKNSHTPVGSALCLEGVVA